MSFRTSLKNLIRRDPTASLRERAADLQGNLDGQTRRTIMAGTMAAAVPLPVMAAAQIQAPTEYADHRDRLLAAYAEDRSCRSIDGEARINSLEDVACTLVVRRCWALASEVAALPPPRTLDGLAVIALGATILWEVSHSDEMQDPFWMKATNSGLLMRKVRSAMCMPMAWRANSFIQPFGSRVGVSKA